MEIFDKQRVVGRLEIIKIDSRTGQEEKLYDQSNVICHGLGRSIAQLMTTDCDLEPECGLAPLSNAVPGVDFIIRP